MPPLSRNQAIAILEQTHNEVDELFSRLSDQDMIVRRAIGGGEWSAKDLLGHIAAWERYSLDTLEALRRGETPRLEDVFAQKGGVDRLNDEAIARDGALPLETVRYASRDTLLELVVALRTMPDEEWNTEYPWGVGEKTEPIGEILGGITAAPDGPFAHPTAHIGALRDYVEEVLRHR